MNKPESAYDNERLVSIYDKQQMAPKQTPEQELFALCQKFIEKHNIWGGEVIYQHDYVIEDAYSLIDDICDIVGYVKLEDEE